MSKNKLYKIKFDISWNRDRTKQWDWSKKESDYLITWRTIRLGRFIVFITKDYDYGYIDLDEEN